LDHQVAAVKHHGSSVAHRWWCSTNCDKITITWYRWIYMCFIPSGCSFWSRSVSC